MSVYTYISSPDHVSAELVFMINGVFSKTVNSFLWVWGYSFNDAGTHSI